MDFHHEFHQRIEYKRKLCGGPNRIRTYGLCLRRAALYPAELWDRDDHSFMGPHSPCLAISNKGSVVYSAWFKSKIGCRSQPNRAQSTHSVASAAINYALAQGIIARAIAAPPRQLAAQVLAETAEIVLPNPPTRVRC